MGPSKRKGSVRRPVLDLNAKDNSPSRPTWQSKYQHVHSEEESHQNGSPRTPPSAQSNPLSGLLGNYNSDSDNEEPTSKNKSHLDAKVEDFLKEIQSISAETINAQTTVAPESEAKEPALYPPSVTAWQQCYDHNSGYPYYWNTETNEVTWEMPTDLKAAIASVAAKQQKPQSQKPQPKPEPEVKKKVCKYPWQTESDSEDEKIEMITSFGPQSGDESEEEKKKPTKKEKKNASLVGPTLPVKSLTKLSNISPAPEDLEGINENAYETSSLLTHGVQDTGPPGVDGFQAQKETVKTVKVSESSTKKSSINIVKSDNLKNESTVKNSLVKDTDENVIVNVQETNKKVEPTLNNGSSPKTKVNIADNVIAQIEKETPPDYKAVKPVIEPQISESAASDLDSQNSTNSKTSSFALIASYGDDSESEDNNVIERHKSSLKNKTTPKPLFPIEIPEEKVKPLFPCVSAEPSKTIDVLPKEAPQEESDPVNNIYNMELDDPAAQKAFKRKKRIEFATAVYGPSTSKTKPSEYVVTAPTTQYNLDPNSNDHQGFGFNALRSQPDVEKKNCKNYGGIQFVKAETLNLNPEPKDKSETEIDKSVPKVTPKETVKDEEIEDAASLLKEKLIFLVGGKEDISPVQLMAIELETLISAWQHGALTPPYLMRWLNEKCGEIIRHEKTAAPPGWTCLWDRKTKRYYYRNSATKAIQWEYPNVEEKPKTKEEAENCGDEMDICDTPPHLSPAGPEKQTDEPPSTPPPPVISDTTENASPPSPTPQPPSPPQISFCSENESSMPVNSKKKKRKAEEISAEEETEAVTATEEPAVAAPITDQNSDSSEAAPPLPPMPPPPPPPPDESPPPLPDSPPPLPLEPDQPLPPGVDEPEYALYRAPKHLYKKAQDSAAYSAELMMTYSYGLPVQPVVASGTQAIALPLQPIDYHTFMHEAVSNPYIVQPAATSHVIHCPAKKPKPSLTSELVSFYSDIAMLDSTPADNSNSQPVPSTSTPPQEPPPIPTPVPPVIVTSSHSSSSGVSTSTSSKISEKVTSNGINVKKKKKIKAATGLSLKKKGVSSLVAKWQQVQQEVRKDYSDDDDEVPSSK